VFISHAGEQKRGFVAFLREEFKRSYPALKVFVDESSLEMGGNAMPAIEAALGDAFVGAAPMHGSHSPPMHQRHRWLCITVTVTLLSRWKPGVGYWGRAACSVVKLEPVQIQLQRAPRSALFSW
jgi:hypothetical protein